MSFKRTRILRHRWLRRILELREITEPKKTTAVINLIVEERDKTGTKIKFCPDLTSVF